MDPVIGLDIAKEESQVQAFLQKKHPYKRSFKFDHHLDGLNVFYKFYKEVEAEAGKSPIVIFESTGHYHEPVVQFLEREKIIYIMVNPIVSHGAKKSTMRKVKTDAIDAYHLCELYYKEDLEPYHRKSVQVLNLRNLTRQHDAITSSYVQMKLQFQANLDQVFPEYKKVFGDTYSRVSLKTLLLYPCPENVLKEDEKHLAEIIKELCPTRSYEWAIKKAGELKGAAIPKGAHLAEFKNGSGYLGSVLKKNGAVGGGQAVLNPFVCNPTMLFMATTLATIDKKLDNIQEMQRELLDFLVQKERSDLSGDLNFLTDVLNNYKYNWNNDTYKNNNYNIVLGIRQEAERKIDFYKVRITTKINKKSFFHRDQWVKIQLEKIHSEFKDYQLALYVYSFSSFLEVILLENFKSEYLNGISKKIEDYSLKYSELYTKCYDQIEGYAQSSLQSKMYKGLTSVSRGIGDSLAKDRDIKKLIGETLVLGSKKLEKKPSERTEQTMKQFKQFIEKQNDYIRPFVENINTVNKLYNQPIELIFDKENIYIGTTEVQ